VPVSIATGASELAAYGPIEGGVALGINPDAADLRSVPFTAPPAFAGEIGTFSNGIVSVDEQTEWIPGYFQSGYFLYVRTGALRGAVLPVTGNDVSSLTITGGEGLGTGDLIAVVPKQSLAEVLPEGTVHESTKVFLAAGAPSVPAAMGSGYFQRGADGVWRVGGAGDAVFPMLEPWSCFRIIHATGAQGTTFQPIGDVASGPVRVSVPSHTVAQDFAFAPVAPVSLSLWESGLSDAGAVRSAADLVEVRQPGVAPQTWRWIRRVWKPNGGGADGSSEVLKPGGAVLLHRAASGDAVIWTQAARK
jgi:hypothetical protein